MPTQVILLAEDNPDDAFIFTMMFERASLPHALYRVDNGQQVIDWLRGTDKYSDRTLFPIPDLLLLDLKMPITSGFDVLEWLRTQEDLKGLPVAVLSSSDDSRDMTRAQQLGVSNYFVKSPKLQDVMAYLRECRS